MPLISVPDMSCGHCKASVEGALAPLSGMGPVEVDLTKRQVRIFGASAVAIAALDAIGFPAREITAS